MIAVKITNLVMRKISYEGKIWLQTLREIGFGYRKNVTNFPEKV